MMLTMVDTFQLLVLWKVFWELLSLVYISVFGPETQVIFFPIYILVMENHSAWSGS